MYTQENLRKAINRRNEDVLREIIASGDVDVNVYFEDGGTPLFSACQGVLNTRIIKMLLDAGADPNIQALDDGTTPLFWAVGEIPSAVKLLLKHGADPTIKNKHGGTPLGRARRDYPAKYKLLLEALPPEKRPPIDTAAYTKELYDHLTSDDYDPLIAEEFVKGGADLNAIHETGYSILTHAIEHDNGFGFEAALDLKADLNKIDGRGKSPLLCAIESLEKKPVNEEFAQNLLEAGANPNLIHAKGLTPLMAAAVRGQVEVVEALLKSGADPALRDAQGRTALDHVREALIHDDIKELREIETILKSKS